MKTKKAVVRRKARALLNDYMDGLVEGTWSEFDINKNGAENVTYGVIDEMIDRELDIAFQHIGDRLTSLLQECGANERY